MDTTGMLKPVRWNTFIKDFVVIQFGFVLYGLAIALMIQANLGTSPWTIFSTAVAKIIGVSIGVMVILTGLLVLVAVLLMREPIGWGTLANILFIGLWVDVWMTVIPSMEQNLVVQSGMLLLSVLVMGFATAIYIGVNAGAGPRDSLMLGVHRKSGLSVRISRAIIEITVSLVGWLLGGPLGAGTLVFAVLIGPSVQWAFRLLKVETKKG